jgi:hypothetical protein
VASIAILHIFHLHRVDQHIAQHLPKTAAGKIGIIHYYDTYYMVLF